jgi:hypothetical protein
MEEIDQETKEEMFREPDPTAPKAPEAAAAVEPEFHSVQAMTPEEIKALPRADAYITHQKRFSRESDVRSDVYYCDVAFDSRTILHLPLTVVQYGLIATSTGKDYVPDQFHARVPVRVMKNHYNDRTFYVVDVLLCEDVRISTIAEKDFALLLEKRLGSGQVDPKFTPTERVCTENDVLFAEANTPVENAEGGAN